MGREIKFRGLDVMTGEWVFGSYVKTAVGMHYIIPQNLIADALYQTKVDKETIGQYTGLKDKNGRKIYEGDIVEESYFNPLTEKMVIDRYVVKYHDATGLYRLKHSSDRQGFDRFLWMLFKKIEVIGNIYEHSHLLKGDNDE
jgi:uncharacterized phage protein (TIGR01671 family)